MEELKELLVQECERKLDYYDVVNEPNESVEYGMIIDFLFDRLADMMKGGKIHG